MMKPRCGEPPPPQQFTFQESAQCARGRWVDTFMAEERFPSIADAVVLDGVSWYVYKGTLAHRARSQTVYYDVTG